MRALICATVALQLGLLLAYLRIAPPAAAAPAAAASVFEIPHAWAVVKFAAIKAAEHPAFVLALASASLWLAAFLLWRYVSPRSWHWALVAPTAALTFAGICLVLAILAPILAAVIGAVLVLFIIATGSFPH